MRTSEDRGDAREPSGPRMLAAPAPSGPCYRPMSRRTPRPDQDPADRNDDACSDAGDVPLPHHRLAECAVGRAGGTSRTLQRRRDEVDQVRGHDDEGRDLGGQRGLPQAADANPPHYGGGRGRRGAAGDCVACRDPGRRARPTPPRTGWSSPRLRPAQRHRRRHPAPARQRHGRDLLEATSLVRRPLGHERRQRSRPRCIAAPGHSCIQPPTDVRSTVRKMAAKVSAMPEMLATWSPALVSEA